MIEKKAGAILQAFFAASKMDEIVLKTAYYRLEPEQHSLELRLHALVHVLQWEEYGLLFPFMYGGELISNGYYDNKFEVDARRLSAVWLADKSKRVTTAIMSDTDYVRYCYKNFKL